MITSEHAKLITLAIGSIPNQNTNTAIKYAVGRINSFLGGNCRNSHIIRDLISVEGNYKSQAATSLLTALVAAIDESSTDEIVLLLFQACVAAGFEAKQEQSNVKTE